MAKAQPSIEIRRFTLSARFRRMGLPCPRETGAGLGFAPLPWPRLLQDLLDLRLGQAGQGQIAEPVLVQGGEMDIGELQKVAFGDPSVEVDVGRRDRLGIGEEAERTGSGPGLVESLDRRRATRRRFASAWIRTFTLRQPFSRAEARIPALAQPSHLHVAAQHFRSDLGLIDTSLVAVDDTVGVEVEDLEEGRRVGHELGAIELAVNVPARLSEPVAA